MITFDKQNNIFYLENKEITYAFYLHETLCTEHLYFGKKTGHDLLPKTYPNCGRSHTVRLIDENGNVHDHNKFTSEVTTPFGGDFSEPSVMYCDSEGRRRTDYSFESYEIIENFSIPGLPFAASNETLVVKMSSLKSDLLLYYSVFDDCNVITRSAKIIAKDTLDLERLYSYSFSLPAGKWNISYLKSGAASETLIESNPLNRGKFVLDTSRLTGASTLNPFASYWQKADERSGNVWALNILYSGNWTIKTEQMPNGLLHLCGGINEYGFGWHLEKGESFYTPQAVLVFSDEGFNKMSHSFHDFYRKHIIDPAFAFKSRNIVVNNWEATRFNFTPDVLKNIISAASGTGIDTFVLDDGWFGQRNSDMSSLGDWTVNEEKLGSSLKDFISFVHSKGLKFGLWFEPEMVNEDSELYRKHPNWAVKTPNLAIRTGRNQLYLDLTCKEVRDYIVHSVNSILDTHEIDYVKWDCNRDVTDMYSSFLPQERQKEFSHRFILGVYDICNRIIKTHPNILFEGCASGGSRFDGSMLYYFPQIWTSDQTDVASRVKIQYGNSYCYPLSAASCHVTKSPNRRAAHLTPLQSRADIAHLGATGYELDISKMTAGERKNIPMQVKAYKKDENLVLEGTYYRLVSPFESNYYAVELVSKDKSKAKIVAYKALENFNMDDIRIYPEGLKENKTYKCKETGVSMKGSSWMNFGIAPQWPAGDFNTMVYHLS